MRSGSRSFPAQPFEHDPQLWHELAFERQEAHPENGAAVELSLTTCCIGKINGGSRRYDMPALGDPANADKRTTFLELEYEVICLVSSSGDNMLIFKS